jgi:hypothetical protein
LPRRGGTRCVPDLAGIKLSDLEVIRVALDCEIAEIMTPGPANVTRATTSETPIARAIGERECRASGENFAVRDT